MKMRNLAFSSNALGHMNVENADVGDAGSSSALTVFRTDDRNRDSYITNILPALSWVGRQKDQDRNQLRTRTRSLLSATLELGMPEEKHPVATSILSAWLSERYIVRENRHHRTTRLSSLEADVDRYANATLKTQSALVSPRARHVIRHALTKHHADNTINYNYWLVVGRATGNAKCTDADETRSTVVRVDWMVVDCSPHRRRLLAPPLRFAHD